jgi:hypothetical protein
MTDQEKKDSLFQQEVSKEELDSVAGGDCGRPSYENAPCPRGGVIVQRCPHSPKRLSSGGEQIPYDRNGIPHPEETNE